MLRNFGQAFRRRLRSVNSIFIFPALALGIVTVSNLLMLGQINTALVGFITDRKVVNARQSGDRLRYQLQLPVTELEKFARLQRTLDLSFGQTAAVLVRREGNTDFKVLAHSDFERSGKGSVRFDLRPEFQAVADIMQSGQGSANFTFYADNNLYHVAAREIYDDPIRAGTQIWLITDVQKAISPVLIQLRWWIVVAILLQLGAIGAFAVVDIQPLWLLKFLLDKGIMPELPPWAPIEIAKVKDAIASYQSEVVEQRQQALAAQAQAEAYADDMTNVSHLFAHDIKGDVTAARKAGELIASSAESLVKYVKSHENTCLIDAENMVESLEFIGKFANRIVNSNENAFRMIDQRNRLANLDETIELEFWPVSKILETVRSVGEIQDGQFILKNQCAEGDRVLCDLTFFPAVLKNLIRNGFVHNDKVEKKVQLKAWEENGFAYFKVSDNGVGMPQAYLQKWGKVQGRAAQLSDLGGSGLGLYSVRKTMDAHHSEVVVKSEEGRGSSFTIRLKGEV